MISQKNSVFDDTNLNPSPSEPAQALATASGHGFGQTFQALVPQPIPRQAETWKWPYIWVMFEWIPQSPWLTSMIWGTILGNLHMDI